MITGDSVSLINIDNAAVNEYQDQLISKPRSKSKTRQGPTPPPPQFPDYLRERRKSSSEGVRSRSRQRRGGEYPLMVRSVPSYPDHEELHPSPSPPPRPRYKLPRTPPPPPRKLPRQPGVPRSLPATPRIVRKNYIRHKQIKISK